MASSIRTEISVGGPGDCPVAQATGESGSTARHVARASAANGDGRVTEEFTLAAGSAVDRPEVEPVFEYGTNTVYRFEREPGGGCVCEIIEQFGCPVADLHACNGTLVVSFYAPGMETVQQIVTELHEWFDGIHVRQLTRTDGRSTHDYVFVDRDRLTDRQRDVLETSYEMGYFDHPKRANAGDVAAALAIAPSTFSEHLAAAQRKLLETILQT